MSYYVFMALMAAVLILWIIIALQRDHPAGESKEDDDDGQQRDM
jgi:uncharacterized membrane protein